MLAAAVDNTRDAAGIVEPSIFPATKIGYRISSTIPDRTIALEGGLDSPRYRT
jgi:hypothetical protein